MIYQITFARTDKTVEYDSDKHSELSILDMAFDNDIFVRAGCRSGYCGACQTELISGEVKYFYNPPPLAPKEGFALLCSCYPISDVTIDA